MGRARVPQARHRLGTGALLRNYLNDRPTDEAHAMGAMQKTITPIDDTLFVERPYANAAAIDTALATAHKAAREWKHVPMAERQKLLTKAVDAFVGRKDEIAEE